MRQSIENSIDFWGTYITFNESVRTISYEAINVELSIYRDYFPYC